MSKISQLGEDYCNLPSLLNIYDKELEGAAEKIKITGRRLDVAISENSAWLHFYDQRKAELHTLVKFFESEEARVRSTLFKSYKESYPRALGEREINRYLDHEKPYLFIHGLLLEVEEMYESYCAVVNAFTALTYALTNLTKIHVSSLENVEI